VGAQRAATSGGRRACEDELRLGTRERALELLAQRAAGAKDEGLDCRDGQAEALCDLPVGAPFELSQHERRALPEGEVKKRPPDVLGARRSLVASAQICEIVVQHDFERSPRSLAVSLPADVPRDRDQPASRRAWALARPERAEGVQERRLGDVLRLVEVANDAERVPVHVGNVPLVQPLECAVRAFRQKRRHPDRMP